MFQIPSSQTLARGLAVIKKSERAKTGRLGGIHAVADEAGVSIATVSRVINGLPTVNPQLSKLVRAAIKRLKYVPNTQARALLSGKSRLLGVIISDLTNPFFPELLQGFEEKAVKAGYETLIGSTMRDPRQMELCVRRMLERNVDGVAVMTFGMQWPLLNRFTQAGIPLVFVDQAPGKTSLRNKNISVIPVDYQRGIGQAVNHLHRLGHRSIAFIAGPRSLFSAKARESAFRAAMKAHALRLPAGLVQEADHTAEGGMHAMRTLLARPHSPTAVLCSNDMTAIGVMHTAHKAGLRIPQDLSVIGFDDIHLARYTLPPLTSIMMSRRDLAAAAVSALKAHADGEHPGAATAPIVTSLVLRQSTAVPRRS